MTIQEMIYNAALENPVTSLFRLTIELGINYSHAHSVVKQMQDNGVITIKKTRKRGQPLMICAQPMGDNESRSVATSNVQRAN